MNCAQFIIETAPLVVFSKAVYSFFFLLSCNTICHSTAPLIFLLILLLVVLCTIGGQAVIHQPWRCLVNSLNPISLKSAL